MKAGGVLFPCREARGQDFFVRSGNLLWGVVAERLRSALDAAIKVGVECEEGVACCRRLLMKRTVKCEYTWEGSGSN